MRKIFTFLAILFIGTFSSFAQNVGIGNPAPIAKLEVSAADSNVAMLTNSSLPLDSAKTRLYFRNNEFYTGAIGTHVTQGSSDGSAIYARLGFYTFSTTSASSLAERMSIVDGGNVGINHLRPTATLDVINLPTTSLGIRGTTNSTIAATTTAGPAGVIGEVVSTSPGGFSAGVRGVNRGTAGNGVGVLGYQAGSGYGVFGSTLSGTGVVGGSTNGTGGYFYTTTGTALNVVGPSTGTALTVSGDVRFTGMNEGLGRVLTSDGNGYASWQNPTSGTNIGFVARLSTNNGLASGVSLAIAGFTEITDDGNAFNPATGVFTAPSAGLYTFKARASFSLPASGNTAFIVRIVYGAENEQTQVLCPTVAGFGGTAEVNVTRKLAAGDQVKMEVAHYAAGNLTLYGGVGSSTIFSGFKVY